jgi:hypothetical protein
VCTNAGLGMGERGTRGWVGVGLVGGWFTRGNGQVTLGRWERSQIALSMLKEAW